MLHVQLISSCDLCKLWGSSLCNFLQLILTLMCPPYCDGNAGVCQPWTGNEAGYSSGKLYSFRSLPVTGYGEFLKNKRPTWCHLLFYFTSYALNMFRTLIYPSSRACDYSVELPHWSYCSWFDVCWCFGVAGLRWYPWCRLKHNCNTDTTPN